ncbi:MAG: Formaldehyde activating enzyme [uncultured Rubrobacteraceae bacterium]|uniref:Formaldehyde activating enzyme n=1 Tax=uncultured Rubrobacteraceae bacterium TaxID=349277 RepID=A0A6J4NZP9_9ACTN|nr:MAG: Formaldehyde activating enzyme [uncultured Rubrobacteraceae bacterium]
MQFAAMSLIGESFVGEGVNAAHVNVVIGRKGGPVETAWTTALATPRMGHAPFVAVVRPGVPALPFTLFVNKATMGGDSHVDLTFGAAQAGISGGVAAAVADGLVPANEVRNLLCIAAVYVNPAADDEGEVFENNRRAVGEAIRAAVEETPTVEDVLALAEAPSNPFFGGPG